MFEKYIYHKEVPEHVYRQIINWPGFNIYHTHLWHEVLNKGAGQKVGGLAAYRNDDDLVFWLPMVKKWRITGRASVCLPLTDKVGPLHNPDIQLQDIDIKALPKNLEIHENIAIPGTIHATSSTNTTLSLKDIKDETELLQKIKPAIRRKIKKSFKAGLRCELSVSQNSYYQFSELQAITRKRQGSPTYPMNFFNEIYNQLFQENQAKLFLVKDNDKIVSGVLFLYYGDEAIYAYGASNEEDYYKTNGANQLAMWTAILDVYNNGFQYLDFGTSSIHHHNLMRYKENWGGISNELPYTYTSTPKSIGHDGLLTQIGEPVLRRLPLPVFKRITPIMTKLIV